MTTLPTINEEESWTPRRRDFTVARYSKWLIPLLISVFIYISSRPSIKYTVNVIDIEKGVSNNINAPNSDSTIPLKPWLSDVQQSDRFDIIGDDGIVDDDVAISKTQPQYKNITLRRKNYISSRDSNTTTVDHNDSSKKNHSSILPLNATNTEEALQTIPSMVVPISNTISQTSNITSSTITEAKIKSVADKMHTYNTISPINASLSANIDLVS